MLAKVGLLTLISWSVHLPATDLLRQGLVVRSFGLRRKLTSDTLQNKPNGQFKLEFSSQAIRLFMRELSIRKVPGVGRVHERLLDSIGIKVLQMLNVP